MAANDRIDNKVSPQIHRVSGWKKLLLDLSGQAVAGWQKTLHYDYRLNFTSDEARSSAGGLILLWHNRLFPGLGALKNSVLGERKLYALVSASRDGAQLSHFLEGQGIVPIRGSSSRRGAVATRELLKVLAQGHNVAITVDGPRGPLYEAHAGAALLIQLTGAPAYFVGVESETCREMATWDRFIVPLPFSRIRVLADRYVHPATKTGRGEREKVLKLIQDKLNTVTLDLHRTRGKE